MTFDIDFTNLSKLFEGRANLKEINLRILTGDLVAIIGPSGAGKTLLAKMMKGFIAPTSGNITLNGTIVNASDLLKNKQIQLVFQNAYDSFTPHRPIIEVILEIFGHNHKVNKLLVLEFVKVISQELSLNPNYLNKFPHELSGGERQRTALLIALLAKPKILICDEILNSLEASLQKQVLEVILKYQKKFGFSFIMITHDLLLLEKYFKNVIVMNKGEITYHGNISSLITDKSSEFVMQCYEAINWLKNE